ncbi:haloacid dehalogenase type II [Natrinema gelatinilyticum]|uniref:haloacid dehalogenase type II n=1 Tax=Natrinema gelatinilyticum TaxID=2961571 RepID=UPI0020C58F74|nr:haloacid dehalogenase type II [Natrinema gelatinilyticum]
MSFSPERVTAITFDSYSTLVDVTPETFESALTSVTDEPRSVARLWRRRSLEYATVSNDVGGYQPFYDFNRAALEYALEVHGVDVTSQQLEEILSVYHEPEPYEDVRDSFERLASAGCNCWILSNGDPDMLTSLLKRVGIEDFVEDAISADEVQTYKPAVELYQHAAARTGTPIAELCHVTAGWTDVLGAMNAGMQSAWVNRAGDPWEAFGEEPNIVVEDLTAFVDALLE